MCPWALASVPVIMSPVPSLWQVGFQQLARPVLSLRPERVCTLICWLCFVLFTRFLLLGCAFLLSPSYTLLICAGIEMPHVSFCRHFPKFVTCWTLSHFFCVQKLSSFSCVGSVWLFLTWYWVLSSGEERLSQDNRKVYVLVGGIR